MELVCGKFYELNLTSEMFTDETFLQKIDQFSGPYKLIGKGKIAYGSENIDDCEYYVYYIFKDINDETIEVDEFEYDGECWYSTIVFYDIVDKVKKVNYSDYMHDRCLKKPNLGKGYRRVDVEIKPTIEGWDFNKLF